MTMPASFATAVFGLLLCGVPSALAEGNKLFIIQNGSGNDLTIDQSRANGSIVGGVSEDGSALVPDEDSAAVQEGDGNRVDVVIEGDDGRAFFSQRSGAPLAGVSNDATISVTDGSTASILQDGSGNVADLNVSGEGTLGSIFQRGFGNESGLTVSGSATSASVIQRGNGNVATDLEVNTSGTNFVLEQIGDGLNANGLTASSNAPGLTVIQRSDP